MICQRNFILIFLPKKQHFYDKKTRFRDFIPNFVKRGKQIALKKNSKKSAHAFYPDSYMQF